MSKFDQFPDFTNKAFILGSKKEKFNYFSMKNNQIFAITIWMQFLYGLGSTWKGRLIVKFLPWNTRIVLRQYFIMQLRQIQRFDHTDKWLIRSALILIRTCSSWWSRAFQWKRHEDEHVWSRFWRLTIARICMLSCLRPKCLKIRFSLWK